MIPEAFEYHRPATVDEALSLLGEYGDDAKLLAGGHSLLPAMKLRLSSPSHLIDIGQLDELQQISVDGNCVVIGGGATHRDVESSDIVNKNAPLLSQSAASIAIFKFAIWGLSVAALRTQIQQRTTRLPYWQQTHKSAEKGPVANVQYPLPNSSLSCS